MTVDEDIKEAVKVLKNGGVILYPTDTIWGIGCDATNAEAVKRIYEIKKREESKSMIALFDSTARLCSYIDNIQNVALDMIEMNADAGGKPLTLILDGAKNVAENLVAQDGSLGVRVTAEKISHDIIYRLGKPIVSTSANISGEATAQTFKEINPAILEAVDYVIEHRRGENQPKQPSSIVRLGANGLVKIIR